MIDSSHRLAARMPGSQPGDRGSSPRESIKFSCPCCGDSTGPNDVVITTSGLPVSPDDFTVCLTCREILRFDQNLKLRELCERDWLDLTKHRDLFVALLQWRLRILMDQNLKEQRVGRDVNGIPGSR